MVSASYASRLEMEIVEVVSEARSVDVAPSGVPQFEQKRLAGVFR